MKSAFGGFITQALELSDKLIKKKKRHSRFYFCEGKETIEWQMWDTRLTLIYIWTLSYN